MGLISLPDSHSLLLGLRSGLLLEVDVTTFGQVEEENKSQIELHDRRDDADDAGDENALNME